MWEPKGNPFGCGGLPWLGLLLALSLLLGSFMINGRRSSWPKTPDRVELGKAVDLFRAI
jgi:hypothetical protein